MRAKNRERQFILPLGIVATLAMMTSSCVVDPSELGDSSVPITGDYRAPGGRALLPAGDWWKCFDDPYLNKLLARLDEQNPSIDVALSRYDQARAALGLARADKFPAISSDVIWKRKRDSSSGIFVPPEVNYSEYRAALNLKWEVDLWGRVRQSVNAARADLAAAEADVAAARLSLQTELARNYFQLRYIDAESNLLKQSLGLRLDNLKLVDAQVEGGETTDLDKARAETEVESVRAQILQLQRARAEFFNALAVLVGETPAAFSLEKNEVRKVPNIPAGVPSELLTRRPDIYAAEQRIRAAAARVGVVKASYFPRITLGATGGVSSLDLGTIFDPSSLFGEVGPEIVVPLYQAGRSGVDTDRAEAEGAESVALYREAALKAFREVEDALAGIHFLDREIEAHRRASSSAGRAAALSQKRYDGGLVSFFEVVDSQRTALDEDRELVQARSARQLAIVQLIQALGGGWDVPVPEVEKESSRKPAQSDP